MNPSTLVIGAIFTRLTIVSFIRGYTVDGVKHRRKVVCECSCNSGKRVEVFGYNLTSGHSKSCGCLTIEATKKANTKHGHNRSRKLQTSEYSTWLSMIARCTNSKLKEFKNYGGRGISVCNNWYDFRNFIADMGLKPFKGAQIERVNNSGNYEPGNCKWATRVEQGGNKRNNIILTHLGETKTLLEWSKIVGIKANTLRDRFAAGWSHSRLLTQKPRSLYKPL